MEEKIFKAALAGLLHDLGQFAQRAGRQGAHPDLGRDLVADEFTALWPAGWGAEIGAVIAAHHATTPQDEQGQAVQVADWLAAFEQDVIETEGPLLLRPITEKVVLDQGGVEENWFLPPSALSLTPLDENFDERTKLAYPSLFPRQNLGGDASAEQMLWQEFVEAVQALPGPIDTLSRFAGLLSVLKRFTSQIPAAPGGAEKLADPVLPDVSLYDHLKVTAAIVPCLLKLEAGELAALHGLGRGQVLAHDRPVARLVRADFGGIQSFIYRITTPEREREHRATAKRLRGRSFYLSLLGEVVADWLLRQLELTAANALYVGGGRFDLLVPVDAATETRLQELADQLQAWLIQQFEGVISLEVVSAALRPADFKDLRPVNGTLDDRLSRAKQKKFGQVLNPAFFQPREIERVCAVCGLTPTPRSAPEGHICSLCQVQKHLGTHLPRSSYIAYLYGPAGLQAVAAIEALQEKVVSFAIPDPGPVAVSVVLLTEADLDKLLRVGQNSGAEMIVYRLNQAGRSPLNWPGQATPAERYLANAAPRQGDQVYDFEEMAALSRGAKLLGVLKADVDHLGLIFGLGLEQPTLSRVTALSHTFDHFFSGYLNVLCQAVTERWRQSLPAEQKEEIRKSGLQVETLTSLFYIVYAGGDDLLIIGPWDQTVELAQLLNATFRAYTCRNPDITLSTGIVMVKPHFPVQRFVGLADEALERAKNSGRDRITIFSGTTRWWPGQGAVGFEQLLTLAKTMQDNIEQKKMPRTLVHDVLRMRQVQHKAAAGSKPMFTPQLLYLLTRRLSPKIRDGLQKPILDAWPEIRIPASFVSLITRKE